LYRASKITAVVSGVIILIFGVLSLAALSGGYGYFDTPILLIYPLCGLLFTASGICGIAGGLLLQSKTRAGRALLLAAGLTGLSFVAMTATIYGLAFFMLFMTARTRAVPQWPEDEPGQAETAAAHD
jgi:hypothetical protein